MRDLRITGITLQIRDFKKILFPEQGDKNENRPPEEEAVDGKDGPPKSRERSGAAEMIEGASKGPLPFIFPLPDPSGIEEWMDTVVGECE